MWGWGGIQAHGQRLCQTCTESVCDPMGSSLPSSCVHGILQARILDWVAIPSPRDLPDLGLNPGLLHCRQILYHQSHQGSPA